MYCTPMCDEGATQDDGLGEQRTKQILHVSVNITSDSVVVRLALDDYPLGGSHEQDRYLFGGLPHDLGHI